MMSKQVTRLLICIVISAVMSPLAAHHSFIAQYDPEQPVTLKGVVTKIEWMNPHVYFYIDVVNEETGEVENWGIEMGPPHMLQRRGWKRNTLNYGDELEIEGSRARNGDTSANARRVTLSATGEVLGAASSGQTITDSGPADESE